MTAQEADEVGCLVHVLARTPPVVPTPGACLGCWTGEADEDVPFDSVDDAGREVQVRVKQAGLAVAQSVLPSEVPIGMIDTSRNLIPF